MSTPLLFGVAVIPAIVGLVQVVKQTGMAERFAPLLSVALGILAGAAQQIATPTPGSNAWAESVTTGIALGLSATGLYLGTKILLPGSNGRTDEPLPFVTRPSKEAIRAAADFRPAPDPTPSPRSGNYPDVPVARSILEPTRGTPDPRPPAQPYSPPPQQTPESITEPQEIPSDPRQH